MDRSACHLSAILKKCKRAKVLLDLIGLPTLAMGKQVSMCPIES